jgi:Glycosyl transferase family 2
MPDAIPTVSVGIPTYNREAELERAVRSVLAQDHRNLDVVVSNDGSCDGTEDLLRRLAAEDARVRWWTQPRNAGHAANFRWVFEQARGEYFMWLSDDDELEPAYIRRCLNALRADPGLVGVCGRGRYHRHGEPAVLERSLNLQAARPSVRVLRYFSQVTLNGALYSVFPRPELERVPFREVISGDWVLVGAMAARGRLRTLEDVHIVRSLTGMSTDAQELAAREFGREGALERHLPHVGSALVICRHIARDEPAYAVLGPVRRVVVAAAAGALIAARFTSVAYARRALERLGLLGPARRLIGPLRAHRHRSGG